MVQASTEGVEKPTPEKNFVLSMSNQLSLTLSRNEVAGTVLKVAVPSCQALAVNAPSGVTVSLFRMPQITTTSASFKGGIVGPHYDPLIPVASSGGQVCPTDTFVWVDVAVAATVTPGSYSFSIGDLPVSLRVWNLTIPTALSMPIYIQLESYKILAAQGYSSSTGVNIQGPLELQYTTFLRSHRIEPIEQRIADPSANSTGSMNIDNFSQYSGGSWRDEVLNGASAPVCAIAPTNISSSWDTAAQLADWEATIKLEPGMAKAWAYITDEPTNLTGTATRAQLVHANAPDMEVMVTHEPTTALLGLVDHFTVIFEYFMTAGHWQDYTQAPGYWMYGSCVSHGNCSNGSPGTLTGTPDLMLDEPDVNDRAFPLVAYAMGAGAALYYDATYALETAWTTQYNFGGNGDGNLLYPGISGQNGLTASGPVGSIRLKAMRQGQYDIEYVNMANAAKLSTNLSTLIPDQYHWSRNNSDFDTLRETIGTSLSQ
jgi:hypothetical protein